jgi:CheY-like chemotaxis protein
MRILLADSNVEVLAAVRLVLEQQGLEGAGAAPSSGLRLLGDLQLVGEARDAVSLFAQVKRCASVRCCPDLVLLDTDLPGLLTRRLVGKSVGCEAGRYGNSAAASSATSSLADLVETLRQLCPTVRVIVLSSRPNVEKECRQAKVDAFACKSDPPDALLTLLNHVLTDKEKDG